MLLVLFGAISPAYEGNPGGLTGLGTNVPLAVDPSYDDAQNTLCVLSLMTLK